MAGGEVYHRGRTRDAYRRLCALASTLLLASAVPVRAQEVEPSLWSRLQRIEEAFRRGNASALRSSLPRQGKVRVDVAPLADGPASYGAGQLEIVFARLFRDQPTASFAFRRQDVKVSGDGTAFARARWVRRNPPPSPSSEDVLTFTLRQEGGDWRVHEVLSSR